jgi:hypothetical protein
MNKPIAICFALLAPLGCDGQQYVSPTTVRLLVTDESTSAVRVDDCDYVPVLLGSEVKSTYAVKGDLSATLTLTRDAVTLEFDGAPEQEAPFVIAPADIQRSGTSADNAPSGYSVELGTACTPKEN